MRRHAKVTANDVGCPRFMCKALPGNSCQTTVTSRRNGFASEHIRFLSEPHRDRVTLAEAVNDGLLDTVPAHLLLDALLESISQARKGDTARRKVG